ncbi:hypothetical protein COO60DRAFT_722467 [Scenedesmus sp. NREL 46B-D3]|nr:hypothetical protein COO60DRAFT_722467 [Scenedesmus sp. NREL 46B-D3]
MQYIQHQHKQGVCESCTRYKSQAAHSTHGDLLGQARAIQPIPTTAGHAPTPPDMFTVQGDLITSFVLCMQTSQCSLSTSCGEDGQTYAPTAVWVGPSTSAWHFRGQLLPMAPYASGSTAAYMRTSCAWHRAMVILCRLYTVTLEPQNCAKKSRKLVRVDTNELQHNCPSTRSGQTHMSYTCMYTKVHRPRIAALDERNKQRNTNIRCTSMQTAQVKQYRSLSKLTNRAR